MPDLPTDKQYELRVDLDGHTPSFARVSAEDFGERGRANVQIGLAPAAE
jgi:hypothetical protein